MAIAQFHCAPIAGYLGNFWVNFVLNNVLTIFVYVLLCICTRISFGGYIARNGSAGSYDMPFFIFSKYCQLVFRVVLSIYISISHVKSSVLVSYQHLTVASLCKFSHSWSSISLMSLHCLFLCFLAIYILSYTCCCEGPGEEFCLVFYWIVCLLHTVM